MRRAKITYRFDHRGQPVPPGMQPSGERHGDRTREEAGEPVSGKVLPFYQEDMEYRRDYSAWKDDFDEESQRIERAIRESGNGYRPPPEGEPAFERTPVYEDVSFPAYRRKSGNLNLFASFSVLAGAILTGIVLGMFVLSIFRGDAPAGEAPFFRDVAAAPGEGRQTEADKGEGGGADAGAGVSPAGGLAGTDEGASALGRQGEEGMLGLPERTYYFVQNGVFSGREGADAASELLKEKGLSAAIEASGAYNVYAGAALTRDDALLISHHLQNEGLEVYVKPYALPAAEAIAWDGADIGLLRNYLQHSRELAEAILSICAMRLNDAQPGALSGSELAELEGLHQRWTEQANGMASETHKALLDKMNAALNSAVLTLEQYHKKPTHAYLWQAQSAASEHLIAQKAFLEAAAL